ncbi:MAG: dephospho-CoA kinase [Betaproteobacteria bacterium]|jgi:dephospho-CoA kinase|nr:dephospho-CoA kinase [Betaproteobacteria bacterium]
MNRTSVWRLGLTGGIGSGKSTVAARLAYHGAAVIDADTIAQSVTASGGTAMALIAQQFGHDFVTSTGALDRQRMRELIFKDKTAKLKLESIIHPLVGQETEREALKAIDQGAHCLVFDVPLLVESGRWRSQVDRVLVVDCLSEVQIARVVERNQLSPETVEGIISAQASRPARLAAADFVVFNVGLSLRALYDHIDQLSFAFGLSSCYAPDGTVE